MIRRDDGNDWLLISQIEHARIAAELAAVWGNMQVASLPVPEILVPAIRDHDDGWADWERSPMIDSETGKPLDFTEMPMDVATEIWEKSIGWKIGGKDRQEIVTELFCNYFYKKPSLENEDIESVGRERDPISFSLVSQISESQARFEKILQKEEMKIQEIRIIRAIASMTGQFDVEFLVKRFQSSFPPDWPRKTYPSRPEELVKFLQVDESGEKLNRTFVLRTVARLVESGILRQVVDKSESIRFEFSIPIDSIEEHSTLTSFWVSEHFCYLAERAKKQRKKNPEETNSLKSFLLLQEQFQNLSSHLATAGLGSSKFKDLKEAGLRYLQFFDRLSLWLCCAERTEPAEFESPCGEKIRFIPVAKNEIQVKPWPFSVDRVELKTPTRRIPATRYESNGEFLKAYTGAKEETLEWTITK